MDKNTVLILVIAAGLALFFWYQNQQSKLQNQALQNQLLLQQQQMQANNSLNSGGISGIFGDLVKVLPLIALA